MDFRLTGIQGGNWLIGSPFDVPGSFSDFLFGTVNPFEFPLLHFQSFQKKPGFIVLMRIQPMMSPIMLITSLSSHLKPEIHSPHFHQLIHRQAYMLRTCCVIVISSYPMVIQVEIFRFETIILEHIQDQPCRLNIQKRTGEENHERLFLRS